MAQRGSHKARMWLQLIMGQHFKASSQDEMSYINKCDGLTAANLQDDMGIGDFMKYLDSFLSDFLKSLNKIRIS